MTLEQLREMMRNIEAGHGIPKSTSFRSRQAGSRNIFEEVKAQQAQQARQAQTNKNRNAFHAACNAAFGQDTPREVKREHKCRPAGKLEMLPFSCSQVGETVHLIGPGVHIRAHNWTVAAWAAGRLNRQHCEGQHTFELLEIEATLLVGQRRLCGVLS